MAKAPALTEKIGALVRRTAPVILARLSPDQIARLCDGDNSHRELGLYFPLLCRDDQIDEELHLRYYVTPIRLGGTLYRVTSQWFEHQRPDYLTWARRHGGLPDPAEAEIPGAPAAAAPRGARISRRATPPDQTPGPGARWRGTAVGDAQSAFVRHLLATLGSESFTKADWQTVCAGFDNRCAYCGAQDPLVIDHVVSLNRTALGEHRLGNLVPSCRPCNANKADRSVEDFLAQDPARLAAIKAHMQRHGYVPIGDNPALRSLFAEAHAEIRALADRWRTVMSRIPRDP